MDPQPPAVAAFAEHIGRGGAVRRRRHRPGCRRWPTARSRCRSPTRRRRRPRPRRRSGRTGCTANWPSAPSTTASRRGGRGSARSPGARTPHPRRRPRSPASRRSRRARRPRRTPRAPPARRRGRSVTSAALAWPSACATRIASSDRAHVVHPHAPGARARQPSPRSPQSRPRGPPADADPSRIGEQRCRGTPCATPRRRPGSPRSVSVVEAGQHRPVVLGGLGEAEARVDGECGRRRCRRPGPRRPGSASSPRHLGDDVVVRRRALPSWSSGPRQCMQMYGTLGARDHRAASPGRPATGDVVDPDWRRPRSRAQRPRPASCRCVTTAPGRGQRPRRPG